MDEFQFNRSTSLPKMESYVVSNHVESIEEKTITIPSLQLSNKEQLKPNFYTPRHRNNNYENSRTILLNKKRHPLCIDKQETFLLTCTDSDEESDNSLYFYVKLKKNETNINNLAITTSCSLPFTLQIQSKGVYPLDSDIMSFYDNTLDEFTTNIVNVSTGKRVKVLHINFIGTRNPNRHIKNNVSVKIKISSKEKKYKLQTINKKNVSFANINKIYSISSHYSTPPVPKIIKKKQKQQKDNVILYPNQLQQVKEKIRKLTKEYQLTYGEILMISIGKYMNSFPQHVEDFFEWFGSKTWKDINERKLDTFFLLSNRNIWLKPLIEEMFIVEIKQQFN